MDHVDADSKHLTILNSEDKPFAIGITECKAQFAHEIMINQHAVEDPQVIVANQEMIEIFQSAHVLHEGQPKIQLKRMFLVAKNQLPLHINSLSSIAFDFEFLDSFFAIGYTNSDFDGENKEDGRDFDQGVLRFEKFYLEKQNF
jgi:hypothetical protein